MEKYNENYNPFRENFIKKINDSDKSVFLVGKCGSGKSTFIKEYLETRVLKNNFIIDGTVNGYEYSLIPNNNMFELYHNCLIIKKILNYVINNFNNYSIYFTFYLERINNLFMEVISASSIFSTNLSSDYVKYFNNPEILLEEALFLLTNKLDFQKITLVVDNFDVIGGSSERYQKYVYNNLKEYFKLLMVITYNERTNYKKLNKDNNVINFNITDDINIVTEILDREGMKILFSNNVFDFKYRLRIILDEDTIKEMIYKTNGDLWKMIIATRALYYRIFILNPNEYKTFIIDYIDNKINKNPLFTGYNPLKRTLYIK